MLPIFQLLLAEHKLLLLVVVAQAPIVAELIQAAAEVLLYLAHIQLQAEVEAQPGMAAIIIQEVQGAVPVKEIPQSATAILQQ
jgi:hypothetical protein